MTTQYSPILKLALPVQGELSGTWGDVVNDNITSMVEQAIAGRVVINTWTANAHTLTTANGTTSEARCAMLELTDTGSALSGAGSVICPAASKIYIVKNASGQNITVKTPSGTGILVPNGRTTFLFCDGTNVVEAMTHTTSLQLGTSTTVTAVLDEDNMASNSATSLATQQSIKAYVDGKVGQFDSLAEVLAVGNTTGSNNIVVDNGQKITTNTIDETTAGSGVTIDSVLLKDDVVNATDVETGSISANDGTVAATIANSTGVITVPSAVLTTADINGGTADNVIIGGATAAAATVTTAVANTSLNIAGTVTVTSILDEDNMASDDAAGLATQQSIKAYVDAQVGSFDTLAEVLAQGNTTGGTDIVVSVDDVISMDNGTNLLPSLTTTGDLNTGLYFPAADEVGLTVGGTQRLNVSASGVTVTGEMAATTMDLSSNAVIDGTALVTGVLTTTAAAVFNGGFAANQESTIIAADGEADNAYVLTIKNQEATNDRSFGLRIEAGSTASDLAINIETHDGGTALFQMAGSGQARFLDGTASLPSISNLNGPDLNTGIFFPAADQVGIATGGTVRHTTSSLGIVGTGSVNIRDFDGFLGNIDHTSTSTSMLISSGTSSSNSSNVYWSNVHGSFSGQIHNVSVSSNSGTVADAGLQQFWNFNGSAFILNHQLASIAGQSTVFNIAAVDTDFIVKSDANANMLVVNAGDDQVIIGAASTTTPAAVAKLAALAGVTTDYSGSLVMSYQAGTYTDYYKGMTGTNPSTSSARGLHLFNHDNDSDGGINLWSGRPTVGSVIPMAHFTPAVGAVFNDGGATALDFRVESDSNAHMLFVDAGSNAVGVGTSSTTSGRGELAIGGMMFFEPGGTAFNTTNPRPSLKRGGDGALEISAGSDSQSNINFYTSPSSGGTLVQRGYFSKTGDLYAPQVIRSFNNSSVYFGKQTDAVSLPNSTTTVVATLTKTSYAYYLAGEFRLVIYDSSSPWGVYNYKQSIAGKTSTHTGGGMGIAIGTAEIVSRLDYTPTVTLVDNRATGGESTATWQIKVNPGTSGPATALTIFQGYMAGASWI